MARDKSGRVFARSLSRVVYARLTNRPERAVLRLATLLAGLMFAIAQPVRADDDVTEVLDALDAAIEEARWKLEFYCTCRFRAALGNSREEAIANREKASEVKGVMARRGDLFRVSGRSDSDDNWPANFECIESPTVQLWWYLPPVGKYGLERQPLRIMRSGTTQDNLRGHLYSCATFHLDVLWYQGWKTGKMLQRYTPEQIAGKKLVERVERPDNAHLVIHSELYHGNTLQIRERTTFATKYRPAVLVKQETFIDERPLGAKHASESYLEASGFVEVKGGWLPSRMTRVSGPIQVRDKSQPQWMADEWVSDDLGKRAPTPEDFVLTIPEHVEVRGLTSVPSVGTVRRLDMNTVTLKDLEEPAEGMVVDRKAHSAQRDGSRTAWLVMVIAGIAALAVTGAVVWRARVRKRG